ncbi:MAG: GTPase Era [Clostridiales Family XIII bacterium]|jgi:GTP-binding protein Era|nr:GTPase Era [Clostridiales Family XIII bacterium]
MKSGFVSIIGRPNVGKSTLLNAIIGEKVAITADKPQTTRNRIRGIYNEADTQIVFIDTPGIARPRNRLGAYMTDQALTTFDEVDIILFVVDEKLGTRGGDQFILERLRETQTPKILAINKMDQMGPDLYRDIFEEYEQAGVFTEILGVSALKGDNVPLLIETLKKYVTDGPAYFPEGVFTDLPERFLAGEIIREKMLHYLRDEVPHGVAVEIEAFAEKPNMTEISAVIYTEKKTHKGIIIGKEGHTLKGIGKSARLELEALLGARVHLSLWVKIKENWRDNGRMLGALGYRD